MKKEAHVRRMEDVERLRTLWRWLGKNPGLTINEISLAMNYDVGSDMSYLLSKKLARFDESDPYRWFSTQHKFYDVRH
jgi:hypothetical protein